MVRKQIIDAGGEHLDPLMGLWVQRDHWFEYATPFDCEILIS